MPYGPLWFDVLLAVLVILTWVFVELRVRKLRRDAERKTTTFNYINTSDTLPPHLTRPERIAARTLVEDQLKNGSKS